jgi:hypothetical protein
LPLLEPIPAEDFENLWQTVNQVLQLRADQVARDVSRMHYTPRKFSQDAFYEYWIAENENFFDCRLFLKQHSNQTINPEQNNADSSANELNELRFETHEERHAELKRIIEKQGKSTRTGFQMKCPAHNGTGDSSLFSAADSPAVKCLKGCDYFDVLRAFDLPDKRLPSRNNSSLGDLEGYDDESETKIEPFPVPHQKCFDGLAGEFVSIIAPHSEGDEISLLIQFLVFFGAIIGRNAHFKVEADKHYTNLFAILVGNTGAGRKGTSFGRVREAFRGLDEHFDKNCIVSGLASGEGLIYHVRDAVEETKINKKTGVAETVITDLGLTDKRLFVYEGEFAQVLRVQKRETNTLSAVLRNFWDTGTHRNMSKNSPLRTTNAHVSITGHITKTELLACLEEIEAANGGLNRYLFVCVRRSKLLPLGGDLSPHALTNLRLKLKDRIEFARNVDQINFTPDAEELWINEYERLETSRIGYLGKVTQRASPYVLRLACIFALLDEQNLINRKHLESALAVWKYCEDSARYIFGNRTGDKLSDDVLSLLRNEGTAGLTKTEIINATGNYHKADRLNRALQTLYENNLAQFKKEIVPSSKKPTERWFAIEFLEFNQRSETLNSGNSRSSDNSTELRIEKKPIEKEREVFEL